MEEWTTTDMSSQSWILGQGKKLLLECYGHSYICLLSSFLKSCLSPNLLPSHPETAITFKKEVITWAQHAQCEAKCWLNWEHERNHAPFCLLCKQPNSLCGFCFVFVFIFCLPLNRSLHWASCETLGESCHLCGLSSPFVECTNNPYCFFLLSVPRTKVVVGTVLLFDLSWA